MRNILLIGIVLLLSTAGGAFWWLQAAQKPRPVSRGAATSSAQFLQTSTTPAIAAPTVTGLAASPVVISVNTPTQVTFTATIDDATVIPTGVNLLRVATNGAQT